MVVPKSSVPRTQATPDQSGIHLYTLTWNGASIIRLTEKLSYRTKCRAGILTKRQLYTPHTHTQHTGSKLSADNKLLAVAALGNKTRGPYFHVLI